MQGRIFIIPFIAFGVAACSNVASKNQAEGSFDYAQADLGKQLVVPNNLNQPKNPQDFQVSEDINLEGPVGEDVDVRAPALVIPIAAGSRIDPDTKDALMWFDQVDDERDLQMQIVQAMETYVDQENVGFLKVDLANKVWETDWFYSEKTSGWLWTDIEEMESMRFRFQLERKSHGRSVSLIVTLIDYMKTDETKATKSIGAIDKKRAEVTMINAIGAHLGYQYRVNNRENELLLATQQIVELGETDAGLPAYIVNMPLKRVWENMPIFFDRYNLNVTDLSETNSIYYVNYAPVDISFWDAIWGDDVGMVEISEGEYEFRLEAKGKKTALTIYDDQGNILPKELLEELFDVMGPALSFR